MRGITLRSAISLLCAALLSAAGSQAQSSGGVATRLSISNREPEVLEVGYLPADGSTPAVNPPAMAWLPEKEAVAYCLELSRHPSFPRARTLRVLRVPYCLYTHSEPLAPGRWYWRYGFFGHRGRSDWSAVRSFVVSPRAVKFPRPTMESVRRALPAEHPRLFVRREQVAALRQAAQGDLRQRWLALKARADGYLAAPLLPEPPRWSGGVWNATEWRRNYGAVVDACDKIETMAFAYLLSGEAKYAQRVREWLLHIAAWDPAGTTSMRVNDEAGMPILHLTARAYDWVHDALSEEDRDILRAMIRARGEEAYRRLHGRCYEQRAYDSHAGRMWHFLGEAAIAYYGEVEEAPRWLEYAITIFWGWYPIWSDEDGGWSEGVAYWRSYLNRITWWLDALKAATGIEGARKPFFSKVGDFALYCSAPGSPICGFGDYGERGADAAAGRVANYFADALHNPYWKWYAQQWGAAEYEDTPLGFLRAARPAVKAKAPRDLPRAKFFRGTGWVVMHSDLTDARTNVVLMFRSSPFGNISHAHNDQNAIALGAYGEPLLVNTGIRPWYGSPFCDKYYWATLSHNCILINGEGQPRAPQARGRISAFKHQGAFAYAAGDASAAYPSARQVLRRIMFLRPDVFVIHDRVVMKEPGTAQWLMHGRSPFDIAPQRRAAFLRHGNAQARITFVAPRGLRWSQTDRYPLEPETGATVPEWHVTAETAGPATEVDFVAIIEVARRGERLPATRLEPVADGSPGVRFVCRGAMVTVAFADERGLVALGDARFVAEAAASIRGDDGTPGARFVVPAAR